jgi:cytochrome b involved in lipid metabolism
MEFGKEIKIGLLLTFFSFALMLFYIFSYNASSQPTTPSGSGSQANQITVSEVSAHNTPDDCWIIINNKVLKITPYLNIHPGGAETITQFCGQDATDAFNTKGGRGRHSSRAVALIENFVVGIIGQNLNTK